MMQFKNKKINFSEDWGFYFQVKHNRNPGMHCIVNN